jgi:lipopolysaccharide transport system permease protein
VAVAVPRSTREIVITPPRRWGGLGLPELWSYRELLYFLTKRELQIRYKQSLLGVSWAVFQPLALTFIFALFFGRLAKVPSEGIPYAPFALAALVPWLFVSQATSQSAVSLVADANLLSKVYFPRLVIPAAKVISLGVDLVVACAVLIAVVALYGLGLGPELALLPLFLALAFVTAVGGGVLLSALNVKYRDVGVALPLMIQVWLFATPVVYPGSLITGAWAYVYALNPMVTVISGARWALLGTTAPATGPLLVSVGAALAVLAGGLIYFRRTERFFADLI